jgi:hypothetical protein
MEVIDEDVCSGLASSSEQSWDTVATNVPDPPKCIADCQHHFLSSVVRNYENILFGKVCQELSNNEAKTGNQKFWTLYCCDSVRCGVRNDRLGQDRESPARGCDCTACLTAGSKRELDHQQVQ